MSHAKLMKLLFYSNMFNADGKRIVNHLMCLYGVEVPLRTRGWINKKLVSLRTANGCYSDLRCRTRKGGQCLARIFDCVNALTEKACSETEAAA